MFIIVLYTSMGRFKLPFLVARGYLALYSECQGLGLTPTSGCPLSVHSAGNGYLASGPSRESVRALEYFVGSGPKVLDSGSISKKLFYKGSNFR